MGDFYTAGPLVFGHTTTPVQFNGVTSAKGDPKTMMHLVRAAGKADPSWVSVHSQEPMFTQEVVDIKKALDVFGLDGIPISSTSTYTSMDQYFAQLEENGDRMSGSNHAKFSAGYGMVLPQELSWQQKQFARLRIESHCGYDGTNNPWVPSAGVALPSNILLDQLYTGGPVYVNGSVVPVPTVQGLNLQWGSEVRKYAGSGEVWPRRLHIETRELKFELTTFHLLAASAYGLIGTAVGASTVKFFLRKYLINQGLVADATAQHIKCTIANVQGIISPGELGGDNGPPGGCKITFCPIEGAAAIVAFDTASAVS